MPWQTRQLARYDIPHLRADLADLSERLTRLEIDARKVNERFAALQSRSKATVAEAVSETVRRLDLRMQGIEERFGEVVELGERERGASRRAYTELAHRLSLLLEDVRRDRAGPSGEQAKEALAASPDPLLTTFYATFEDRFRGTREDIRDRVAAFLPDARDVLAVTGGKGPIVDLGCGRGEWLEVLSRAGIPCLGIDNNEAQLAGARTHGLPVLNADALTWLKKQPPASVPMITAFHLIEHLPFAVLVQFAAEVLRVLMPGGLALFETPNPENVVVGAFTFNFDPTHVKPLPPGLTSCLMEVLGFTPVKIRPLHPDAVRDRYIREGTLPPDVAKLLFGPRDYAVLAYKPGP
jgi:O-antigen chain-terminating methyltransferase